MPVLTLSDIEVEEVTVEYGLHAASDNCNEVEEAFHIVAIHPVENVQRAVDAECKQVVTRDRLSFASLAYHKQLWQDCHWLQVDRKCP